MVTSPDLRKEIQTNITGKNNIRAGIAYLYTRALDGKVKWNNNKIDDKQVLSVSIEETDNKGLDEIAKRLGTTTDNMLENNPGLTRTTVLQIGQKFNYQKAHSEREIKGWNDWKTAIYNYNGGGDSDYMPRVSRAYQIILSREQK